MDPEQQPSTKGESKSGVTTSHSNAGQPVPKDDALLAELGHAQELRREFSIWSLGSLCLCLMATWEATGSVLALALLSGGAPCLFYNYILAFLGTIAIAYSLAEISSIYPTAGGQYHWVAALAPPQHRRAASWFTGWISVGGQICLTASSAFAGGLQYRGLVSLNDTQGSYVPTRWHGMLFYWAILLYSLVVNLTGSKPLSMMNSASGLLHIAGWLALSVVIGVMAPKHDAHYVFVETVNETGWANDGLAWMIGMLSAVYPFLGYDAAAHLAEEIPNAPLNVPRAMVYSVLVNGVLGLVYTLILLFGLGDLASLLASPTGFPFMQLNLNTVHSRAGASVMALIPTVIATVANAAGLTSTSRTFWAFARDDAIPHAAWWAHVHPKLKIPVRMVFLVSALEFLLGLIYLGSSTAFNAILSMAILGMYLSYALPVAYMLVYGRRRHGGPGGDGRRAMGPWKMGPTTGKIVNLLALLWLTLAMFFSTWPNFYPVTQDNMNYSTVVLAGWVLVGAVYYFVAGKKRYQGPVVD